MTPFTYEPVTTTEEMRKIIQACENEPIRHIQQVSYSTFHDALTQVCFSCRKVRSNMNVVRQ